MLRMFDIKALGQLIFECINHKDSEICAVIPLYNYERYVQEAPQSVLAQDLNSISIVVVDDCSTDGGGDVARRFLETQARRFGVARLIRHHHNQGPSMARNSGIVWSDEPFLFMLDADNLIRRPTLSRLLSALSNSGADFAYPQLCFFGTTNGIGRADVWAIGRLRYGNYIDVMALIKRDALVRAGGFGLLSDDIGLEDYDLWCRFAELGFQGVFLPELLGEYRVHDSARTNDVIRIGDPMNAEMALRHPFVFGR
jgi:glycosyltransferase involved in cell wall biosynthesis